MENGLTCGYLLCIYCWFDKQLVISYVLGLKVVKHEINSCD